MVTADPRSLNHQLEFDASLLRPDRLRERLDFLDGLDARFGDADSVSPNADLNDAQLPASAMAIRARLEAVNDSIYQAIRSDLQQGSPGALVRWIQICKSAEGAPAPGLGYDYLDEFICGVFQLGEPSGAVSRPAPEEVFYQPTPARHILHLIEASALASTDVLIDLGAGLGHVPMLASILTSARSVGVEVQAAYVASAVECARSLGLSRADFVQRDALAADLSAGTVFYLYTPFTGGSLLAVLRNLRRESESRPIRICTLGPCTPVVAKETWLEACEAPVADRIVCFGSI